MKSRSSIPLLLVTKSMVTRSVLTPIYREKRRKEGKRFGQLQAFRAADPASEPPGAFIAGLRTGNSQGLCREERIKKELNRLLEVLGMPVEL